MCPTVLDIGCGVGWHPIQYASLHPDEEVIAVEHGKTRFEKMCRRLDRHPQLKNIIPIQMDAHRYVADQLKNKSLTKIFFLYPNPYAKPKLAKKRWHNQLFMKKLVLSLLPGGEIVLATNEAFYAEEFREKLKALGMQLVSDRVLPLDHAPRTHFEKKYLERGERCFEHLYRKREPTDATFPT